MRKNKQENFMNGTVPGKAKYKVDLSLIRSINKSITSRMSLEDLLESILDAAKNLVSAESSSLLLSDISTGDLIFNVVIGEKGDIIRGERMPGGKGIAGFVAESGKALIVNDTENDPRHFKGIDEKSGFNTRNIISVPMVVMDELVGVLEIVNSIGKDEFTDLDLEKAKYIAEQAALAITNRRLYDDLEKRIDELSALFDVSNAISFSESKDNVLQNIIQSLASSMDVDRASIGIYNSGRKKIVLEAHYGIDTKSGEKIEVDIDNSILGQVFKSADPMIVTDVDEELSEIPHGSTDYNTKSFISIPIISKNEVIGVLSLTDKKSRRTFDSFDLRVLSTVASQIGEAYQNIRNRKEKENQKRLAQEIDIAAQIQRKILPDIPENFRNHLMAAFNRPAKYIGGDFYDFFQITDNKYGVLVADISGKGIPSALFMGAVRNIIRAERQIDTAPGRILTNSNRLIYQESEYGMFVTLFYAVIDIENKTIRYSSAGHDDQLLIGAGDKIEKLNAKGKPLGILDELEFEEKTISYNDGDMFLLFTDGVVERLGGENLDPSLGEKRLSEIAIDHISKGPAGLVNYLEDYLNNNRLAVDFRDDFTIFAIQL